MSILKKTSMALALAAAVGFSAASMAYTVTASPALPLKVANVSVDATTGDLTFAAPEVISYAVDSSDNIIGRTTGFSVRLTLQNGATFLTTPTVAAGPGANGWTASVTAGGGSTDNFVVISLSPGASTNPVTNDVVVTISMPDISATTLATVGSSVSGKFDIFDPVGGGTFDTQTKVLVTSANVLASSMAGGDTTSRIDVGTNATYAASKTAFATTGVIGSANSVTFDAGTLTQAVAAGVSYSYQAADAFTTVVSLGTLGNFIGGAGNGSISLATSATCATPITGSAVTYNAAANTATVTYTAGNLVGFAATGGSAHLCFTVPGNKTISDSTVTTSSSFVASGTGATSNSSSADGLPLKYNGSVVKVPMFNPGGNTVQQSVLRVSNTSGLGGKVTVTGTDDAGAASTPVTFQLGAGSSMQINADTLQNGGGALTGALGTPTGKWRLVVTGEFNGLVVQSLMRNNSTGTFTNMSTSLVPGGVGQ